ncbi:Cytochrome c oxidase subunit VIIc [Penicillium brevicompactum]|uniref:Cytochrome c oxidase subunit VIIc n=1 Tax=Penicillium brevicompactum TaxID=5074 RepID=A0A9W9QPT1_PENBR|nr:Cytochrome c oxidase subunit VIIc [Penicillium brevicompactum]
MTKIIPFRTSRCSLWLRPSLSERPFSPLSPARSVSLVAIALATTANIPLFSQMYSSAIRARMATSFVARRGFSTTRTQLGSPYHYAEGPRTNIPFNPLTKFFFLRYWGFMS